MRGTTFDFVSAFKDGIIKKTFFGLPEIVSDGLKVRVLMYLFHRRSDGQNSIGQIYC